MANKKATRRALFMSVISLILCCAMLMGTTFAWFTDSVTSGRNIIKSGNLDVVLEYKTSADADWAEVTADTKLFKEGALYEPGYTELVFLRVSNAGSLALKAELTARVYNEVAGVNVKGESFKLSDYLQVGTYTQAEYRDGFNYADILLPAMFADREQAMSNIGTMTKLSETDVVYNNDIVVEVGDKSAQIVVLALHMPTSVGNVANHDGTHVPSVDLGIELLATQLSSESDHFGPEYDLPAVYPGTAAGNFENNESVIELEIRDQNDTKVGTAKVPAAAVADKDEGVEVTIDETNYNANINLKAGETTKAFDVTVTGLKEGNTDKLTVELRIEPGLDPATVSLYHYDTLIESSYNPNTGYVTFQSATFSPFTVVYDAESEYVPPVADENALPKADVTPYTDTNNIEWSKYGQWSPTEGLEANLEAAYKFKCIETAEEAAENPYANWYCDFYVSLDRDLGENEIFLGGYYGSYGWVGFHNGDVTLAANEEIGLLESVTTNPWTYLDIATYVNEFICGVGDVNDALADATFTVALRLTNPANPAEFHDVETITHTFAKVVNSGDELQDAINNGNGNIQLGGDIDLNNGGIVIP